MKDKQKNQTAPRELQPSDLRYVCDPKTFRFTTTKDLPPLDGIIGQDRAHRAIEFGLAMESFGYNIFVAGVPGTGKKTLVRSLVEKIAADQPVPNDLFFVHNFDEPDHPRVISVPPGMGCQFRSSMQELIETLQEEVPKAFKSEAVEGRRAEIIKGFQEQRATLIEKVQEAARQRGLSVKSSGTQIMTVPLREGRELTPEQFEVLPKEEQEQIRRNQEGFSEDIQSTYREIRERQLDTQQRLKELDRSIAAIATGQFVDELRQRYQKLPSVLEYLKLVQGDIIDNISDFVETEEESTTAQAASLLGLKKASQEDPLKRYQVNVIVDNCNQKGAPVISESNATYRNLIGFMEREARMGTLYTDFTMIRAGSLLAANGGYVILDLIDLLTTPLAWGSLKRALQDGEVRIQDPTEQYGLVGTHGLRPEPVKLALKVIVLGNTELYGLLYAHDEDFRKLFKIKADFDTVIKKKDGHLEQYARFVKKVCDEEHLRHFQREAVCTLIEHSSRMVSDKTRVTLRFSDVADLIRESNYWAGQSGHKAVETADVEQAIGEKIYRSNLVEERLQEMIDEDSILIQTSGTAIGQINGLSVYQMGDYAFGKPSRVTAQVGVGEKGVVNIEREARLSGRIHDKGVLILSGYLHGKYGQQQALSLHASICFEQSYSGVEGDSASSTELYAILSSLAEVPIRQSIAVTGSINQKGIIQPIGGVNEKVEGFFATCRADGLSGDQGVVIPHQNVQNLMLKRDVIEAVAEGQFHIYPVETVDQGLEILTGEPAGMLQEDGTYPEGSIHAKVQQRLEEMAAILQRRRRPDEEEDLGEENEDESGPTLPDEPGDSQPGSSSPAAKM